MPSVSETLFDGLDLDELRKRRSAKWSTYPADVLPVWLAEMDFPLAEPVREALHQAIARDDVGYAPLAGLARSFVDFAAREYAWTLHPRQVLTVADVMTGVAAVLDEICKPGDRIVVNPPIYPPFLGVASARGRECVTVPLRVESSGRSVLDLEAIEAAYARGGVRAHVLASPHNPTGTVHDRETLSALAKLAERHGVLVLSDEIHAPLTLAGATHTPFTASCDEAKHVGVVLTSASKTWNLAGLKAAVMVAEDGEAKRVLSLLPEELPWHAGSLGVLAGEVAFEHGAAWRERALRTLDRNRRLLAERLAEHLPAVRYHQPEAGYLAWLDCRALDLGADPALHFRQHGRVGLSSGPAFGHEGHGFARFNFATSAELVEEAVRRMASALQTRPTP